MIIHEVITMHGIWLDDASESFWVPVTDELGEPLRFDAEGRPSTDEDLPVVYVPSSWRDRPPLL